MFIFKIIFIYTGFFSSLSAQELPDSENFFPVSQNKTPASSSSSDYKCQIDQQCLDTLKNELLNTESDKSLHYFCKNTYQDSQTCCRNPSQCTAPFGQGVFQTLREKSLKSGGGTVNCSSKTTKQNLLNIYNTVCDKAKEFCKDNCGRKLKEFKGFFRTCFSISDSYTIDEALKKASNSSQGLCYQEMRYVVEKYKEQSLNKTALFQENIKVGDMVNCEKVEDSRSKANFRSFEGGICKKAKTEKPEKDNPEGNTASIRLSSGVLAGQVVSGTKNDKVESGDSSSTGKISEDSKITTASKKRVSEDTNLSANVHTDGDIELQKSLAKHCPVSLKSAVVFQSVEAPQIKPIKQQFQQADPDNPYFPSYDLVANKPSGVLVTLEKSKDFEEVKDFKVSLDISRNELFFPNETSQHSKCFHNPLESKNSDPWMRDGTQDSCSVKNVQFTGTTTIYKFFGLHNGNTKLLGFEDSNKNKRFSRIIEDTERTISARVKLSSASFPKCNQEVKFSINVIKTNNLNLGFTGINPNETCKDQYKFSNKVGDFANSIEIKQIKSMFPVEQINTSSLSIEKIPTGECNNKLIPISLKEKKSNSLLSDIKSLENIREEEAYNKLFAIVPRSYFKFHKENKQTLGMMIRPIWRSFYPSMEDFKGGSWNVGFIVDDQKNMGVIAHELAHLLGQEREFYEDGESCRHFSDGTSVPCKDSKFIPRFLNTDLTEKSWEYIKENQYSIMTSTLRGQINIETKWIDRDTHQKAFWTLSHFPSATINKRVRLFKRISNLSKSLIISGLYNKKTDSLIISEQKIKETKLQTPSLKKESGLPFITFQLKERDQLLKEIRRPIFDMEIETFYKNKAPKVRPFDFSHVMAVFKFSEKIKNKSLRVVICGPKGNPILRIPIRFNPQNKENLEKTSFNNDCLRVKPQI